MVEADTFSEVNDSLLPEAEVDDSPELRLVVFRLAAELYAADITDVREIIRVPKYTSVPRAPRDVIGVMNLRGRIIPIVDLRIRLDLAQEAESRDTRVMVVEAGGVMVGCLVDAVREVLTIRGSAIEPADSVSTVAAEHLRGIAKRDDTLVTLVDMRSVLSDYLQAVS